MSLESAISRGAGPACRILLGAAFFALCVYALCFPVTCTDIWWHLAAGRRMLEEGRLLLRDPFADDVLARPWTNLHWLFQLLAYAAHRLHGVTALVLGKAVLGAVGAWLLLRAAEAAPQGPGPEVESPLVARAVAVPLLALPIYASRFLVLERPILVTLLMLPLYLLVVERFWHAGRRRALWPLLPLQLVWVNSQGGLCLLGPAVTAAYLGAAGLAAARARLTGRRAVLHDPHRSAPPWRGLLAAVIALVLVSLINPGGPRGLLLPFKLLDRIEGGESGVFSLNVSENVPPRLVERTLEAGSLWHFKWIAAAAFASFVLGRPGALLLGRLFLLGGCFGLALLAGRNVLLFEWLAGFILAVNVGGWLRRRRSLGGRRRRLVSGGLLVAAGACLLLLGVARARAAREEGAPWTVAPFRVPEQAVSLLRRLDLPGRVFNSVRYGGYLIWALHPRYRPSIDGRLVLRSAAEFAAHLEVVDHPERFEALVRARDLRVVLLPTAYPDRYLPLVRQLCRDRRWRLLYTDGTEVLLARGGSGPVVDLGSAATVSRLGLELADRFRRVPRARELALFHLGRLLAEVGELDRARQVLRTLRTPAGRGLLARVDYLAGRREEARREAEALLRERPADLNSLGLLALIALDSGLNERALELAARALEVDPYDGEARRIVERLRREAKRP